MEKPQLFEIYPKNIHIQNKQPLNEARLQLFMRRAESQDIEQLSEISRLCYTYLLRWQGPRFHNKKRWRLHLETQCCEVWTCLNHGQIIGFFTLILDRQKCDEADTKPQPGLFVRLYMLGTCPKLFTTIALRKLKRFISRILRQLFRLSFDYDKTADSKALSRFDDNQVPRVGYIAVIPSMQGKGIATKMVQFCSQRAGELGYKKLWVNVERINIGAGRIMEKAGFEVTKGINYLAFEKQL